MTPWAEDPFCYLTTTGRRSGRAHRIEIWFATEDGRTLLLMAGGRDRSDWVQNLQAEPAVQVEVGGAAHDATARVLAEGEAEDAAARRLLVAKYGAEHDLDDWGRRSLAVALDLRDG